MPGRSTAVATGDQLVQEVLIVAANLGLEARVQFRMGKRIWGADRRIDVILTNPEDRNRLGIECKYQGVQGSAEEKIPAIINDIAAWPIRGVVVFAGDGLSANMKSFLIASGKAPHLSDLTPYLQLFFGLPI